MHKSDIIKKVCWSIETVIGGDWKCEVSIFGISDRHINFEIDQKEYVLVLNEVKDGHHWGEYVFDNSEKE